MLVRPDQQGEGTWGQEKPGRFGAGAQGATRGERDSDPGKGLVAPEAPPSGLPPGSGSSWTHLAVGRKPLIFIHNCFFHPLCG